MVLTSVLILAAFIATNAHAVRIKDIADIKGVRNNQLVGYGLVVGLDYDDALLEPYEAFVQYKRHPLIAGIIEGGKVLLVRRAVDPARPAPVLQLSQSGDELPALGRQKMMQDMDAWGYSFRLGSTRAWFEQDAGDARAFLEKHELIDHTGAPTWQLRS